MNETHFTVPGGTVHYRGEKHASHKSDVGWYGCASPVGLYGPFSKREWAEEWVAEQARYREEEQR